MPKGRYMFTVYTIDFDAPSPRRVDWTIADVHGLTELLQASMGWRSYCSRLWVDRVRKLASVSWRISCSRPWLTELLLTPVSWQSTQAGVRGLTYLLLTSLVDGSLAHACELTEYASWRRGLTELLLKPVSWQSTKTGVHGLTAHFQQQTLDELLKNCFTAIVLSKDTYICIT